MFLKFQYHLTEIWSSVFNQFFNHLIYLNLIQKYVFFYFKSSCKNSILRIFINMRPKLDSKDKRIKISITIKPEINQRMENDLINKSKLIESLLIKHYGKN
jgi:hypothetical protein